MKYFFSILIALYSISAYSQWQTQQSVLSRSLNSITFSTDSIGFASNGDSMEITLNGGKNWNGAQFISKNIKKILFTSPKTGFALSILKLYRTNDGGLNWTESHVDFIPDRLCFINPAIGFMASDNSIETTADSGKTWSKIKSLPIDASGPMNFISADLGYMAGFGGYAVIGDTGKNMTYKYINSHTFNAVCFLSAKTGYISGMLDTELVLKTIDSGKTWRSSCTNINIDTHKDVINDMHFINADTGYVCGTHGLIFVTTDGGETWQKQESNTTSNLTSMYFRSSKNIYIISDSTIIHTANGGFGKSGIKENIEAASSFKLYPNPAANVLHLTGDETIKRISIENAVGQELYARQVYAKTYDLLLSDFRHAPGLHIVKVQTNSQLYSYKVLFNN